MIQNKRDLGGLRTAGGRVLRPGLLIRSAHLAQAEMHELTGISAVIDLRTKAERDEAPDRTYHAQYHALPIFEGQTAGVSHTEDDARAQRFPGMATLYRGLILDCAASFERVLRTIMAHDFRSGAVLWHCTEGKDRCGLTTALLLEALGVDRETILEDYLKTNLVNRPKAEALRAQARISRGEDYAASIYQAYIADAQYLLAAWDAMGEGYLQTALHLTEAELQTFRETVLR